MSSQNLGVYLTVGDLREGSGISVSREQCENRKKKERTKKRELNPRAPDVAFPFPTQRGNLIWHPLAFIPPISQWFTKQGSLMNSTRLSSLPLCFSRSRFRSSTQYALTWFDRSNGGKGKTNCNWPKILKIIWGLIILLARYNARGEKLSTFAQFG